MLPQYLPLGVQEVISSTLGHHLPMAPLSLYTLWCWLRDLSLVKSNNEQTLASAMNLQAGLR